MFLYLVRHAEANHELIDSLRSLSEKGKADINRVNDHLENLNLKVKTIYHSGKQRAVETATILSMSVNSKEGIEHIYGLKPMDDIIPIENFVSEENEDIMIVGHLPFMNLLASKLTGKSADEEIIQFPTGCVLCLQKEKPTWHIKWKVVP